MRSCASALSFVAIVSSALVCRAQSSEVCAPSPAQHSDAEDEQARLHFDSGRAYYAEADYAHAVHEFEAAYRLSGRAEMLLNLASTHERLGEYRQAAACVQQWIDASPDDPARSTMERRVQNLLRRAGEQREPAASEAAASNSVGPGAIAALTIGGVGLATFAIFAALTANEYSIHENGCARDGDCTPAELSNISTFALVADISLGIGLAAAAVGTILLIVDLTSAPPQHAMIAPWVGPSTAGLILATTF